MFMDAVILLAGIFLLVGGPVLALKYYENGGDGPTGFMLAVLALFVGIGLITGFAG